MTCEKIDTPGGPVFICWSGAPPKDKKVRCSVCRRRWATLLCDGVKAGPAREVAVTTPFALSLPVVDRETCDAPLCEDCTTRPAPGAIALPGASGGFPSPLERAKHNRRMKRQQAKPLFPEEPDTRDFCPSCAAALR